MYKLILVMIDSFVWNNKLGHSLLPELQSNKTGYDFGLSALILPCEKIDFGK